MTSKWEKCQYWLFITFEINEMRFRLQVYNIDNRQQINKNITKLQIHQFQHIY